MVDKSDVVSDIYSMYSEFLESYRLPKGMKDLSYDKYKDNDKFKKLIELKTFSESKIEENIKSAFLEKNIKIEFDSLKKITDFDEDHLNNLIKNTDSSDRYSDIKPYIYNHLKLSDNTYVNASRVNGFLPSQEKMFIATQGPLEHTQQDFWKMIVENNVKIIIMLCKLKENGRDKCYQYWPSAEGVKSFNDIKITHQSEIEITPGLNQSKLIVSKGKTNYELTHLLYSLWPDHGAPEVRQEDDIFDKMITYVDNYYNIWDNNNLEKKDFSPILIHCSAGVGRTGTFMACYNAYSCLKYQKIKFAMKNEKISLLSISTWNIVRKLKEQRMNSTENVIQYKFFCDQVTKMIRNILK